MTVLIALVKHFNKSPELISKEELKEYLYEAVHRRGLSSAYVRQTISAMKILYKDVLGIPWDDQMNVKFPKKEQLIPEVLSKEEILKMIAATSNIKHKAIIAVLYSSGIRRDELLHLHLTDIDSKRMVIRVHLGKGNKSRDVILAENTLALLRRYYQSFHPKPCKYVFEAGNAPGKPYSESSVLRVVQRASKKAGIKKNVCVHTLRHSFATHMLEQGANLKLIQRLLGHNSLRTTTIYLHVAKVDNSVKSPFDLP